jgi:aminopeptidase-like protein
MHKLAGRLYPICRSITGNGVRETLRLVREMVPLEIREVPTGTPVFDWKVPREWNIRGGWIKGPDDGTVVDFNDHNLHVVNYSVPVHTRISLEELKPHLHTLPEQPDLVPYRTSYYRESWGFCLTHRQLESLGQGPYEVFIDSTLEDGHLTYGEYRIPGETGDEVLLSCHICHPSLANDNLSGIAVCAELAQALAKTKNRYSYRFLFIPGTIGSITWLALNEEKLGRIRHGLVVANVGDGGCPTYKKTRSGAAEVDQAAAHVLRNYEGESEVREFIPYGYDERQYCSPGINLPVGCLMRTPFAEFPEYHTSADNLELIRPEHLADSLVMCGRILAVLDGNRRYLNTNPKCEPQLGRRGLYDALGGHTQRGIDSMTLLWVLNFSDGAHSLLDIADRAGLDFSAVEASAELLAEHGLLNSAPEVAPQGNRP